MNFIESVYDQKVIIDTFFSFHYGDINCVKALSVFSYLWFDMNEMNDTMTAIEEYVENNGGVINTVTSVDFNMVFNSRTIVNMIKLLTYFPNLENVKVWFNGNCDPSLNDSEIHQLFSALPIRNVKKLTIYYFQKEETPSFYRFIVELMKMCQKMSTLEFHYHQWNSFAINMKEMVQRENIHFPNLNTFIVNYKSADIIDISIDLFYVTKYNIKNLSLRIDPIRSNSVQYFDGLDQYEYFFVKTLDFVVFDNDSENFIDKLLTKFPHVTEFSWHSEPEKMYSCGVIRNMKMLKKFNLKGTLTRDTFIHFLSLLPHDLESLRLECYHFKIEDMEYIENAFYEKFPTATVTMIALKI